VKNKTVVGPELSPDWVKKIGTMLAEIFRQLCLGLQGSRQGLTLKQVQLFIEHRNPFEATKQVVLRGVNVLVEEWQKFYKEVFNLDADFSNLQTPEEREGFNWLVVVVPGMTPQHLFDKCKELFRAWKWTDKNLDEIIKSDRNTANGAYAVWFRDRVEADEELKNLSANGLKQKNIPGITLEERILFELFFYWKTKKHLDINNVTLCSGSRYDDGDVPNVHWYGYSDGLLVHWYRPDNASDRLRAREVVS
jgi:hypothetical protein